MIYTHAPTDPLILQQTIQARESQILAMSQLLAELNEKLSKVEAENQALENANEKIKEKLDHIEQQLAQEIQDKKIIEAKSQSIAKKNEHQKKKEKTILDEKEANKENISPIGIYFPIGKKAEKKPKWLFWSKKPTKEYEVEDYGRQIPSFEKKPQKEDKVHEDKSTMKQKKKESADQEEEDAYSGILKSIRQNLELTIPEL